MTTATISTMHYATATKKVGRHRADDKRTIHLVDLENLVGGRVTPDRCVRVWQEYADTVGISRDDQLVVAVANRNGAVAAFSLPRAVQLVLGADEPDGADHALVNAIDFRVVNRFDRVVIGSADHYFVPLAQRCRKLGRDVAHVIVAAKHVSTELYLNCPQNYFLPIHSDVS